MAPRINKENEKLILELQLLLQAEGALPFSNVKQHRSAGNILALARPHWEVLAVAKWALKDKWHGPRFLDGGIMYLRRFYHKLRSDYAATGNLAAQARTRGRLRRLSEVEA